MFCGVLIVNVKLVVPFVLHAAAVVGVSVDMDSVPVKWAYGVEGNATFLECEADWPQANIHWTLQADGGAHTTVITTLSIMIKIHYSFVLYCFILHSVLKINECHPVS